MHSHCARLNLLVLLVPQYDLWCHYYQGSLSHHLVPITKYCAGAHQMHPHVHTHHTCMAIFRWCYYKRTNYPLSFVSNGTVCTILTVITISACPALVKDQ